MKTKLEMAHEWYMMQTRRNGCALVADAWKYADAMQAAADERENKERPDVLLTKDKDGKCLHFHREFGHKKCMDCGASLEEWKPDWSQAPDGYNYWAFDGFSKRANWYKGKPYLDEDSEIEDEWNAELGKYHEAPSFGYTGDWRESLRKRPK